MAHLKSQTMCYLTCTIITSVDLARNRVSHAKDWVSVDCGTSIIRVAAGYCSVAECQLGEGGSVCLIKL